jgi:tripartite-type tricarboxylate transporter receptor subunit TctC
MIKTTAKFLAWLAIGFVGFSAVAAQAVNYPEKPVRIIVPYPPGGFNDTMGRVFAKKLQDAMGQPFIVENKPGAGTIVGTQIAAQAPADGYTLLVAGFSLVTNQYLYQQLPYNAQKDFDPLIVGAQTPNFLVVKESSPMRSLGDFVAKAKGSPGKLNYGSAGVGSSLHLTMEYLKSVVDIKVVHVPYKGSAPMLTDLLGGQVDVIFDNTPNVLPHIKTGKMRALAVTGAQRSPLLPNVPTVAEQGYPGFDVSVWYGLVAPAGTPREILAKLNGELNKALQSEDVKKIFAEQGVVPVGGSVEDTKKFFHAQAGIWSKVIRRANIKAD